MLLSHIQIFPIKSLDPVNVESCRIMPSGAIQNDRRFAIVDDQGSFVNGKRTPRVHQLRTRFQLEDCKVWFTTEDGLAEFDLVGERQDASRWLSGFFGFPVDLIEDQQQGFPDDLDSPGPTVISTASLHEVGTWFGGLSQDETRRRFRANLEITCDEPFWEDRLCGEVGTPIRFQIGDVELLGTNPCQRCVVPSRCTNSGEAMPGFNKRFVELRSQTLPVWAPRERFNHFYRLAVNTRPANAAGGELRVGDAVRLLDG